MLSCSAAGRGGWRAGQSAACFSKQTATQRRRLLRPATLSSDANTETPAKNADDTFHSLSYGNVISSSGSLSLKRPLSRRSLWTGGNALQPPVTAFPVPGIRTLGRNRGLGSGGSGGFSSSSSSGKGGAKGNNRGVLGGYRPMCTSSTDDGDTPVTTASGESRRGGGASSEGVTHGHEREPSARGGGSRKGKKKNSKASSSSTGGALADKICPLSTNAKSGGSDSSDVHDDTAEEDKRFREDESRVGDTTAPVGEKGGKAAKRKASPSQRAETDVHTHPFGEPCEEWIRYVADKAKSASTPADDFSDGAAASRRGTDRTFETFSSMFELDMEDALPSSRFMDVDDRPLADDLRPRGGAEDRDGPDQPPSSQREERDMDDNSRDDGGVKELRTMLAPRAEVVHALMRDLTAAAVRDTIQTLRSHALSELPLNSWLKTLSKKLARRGYQQTDWVLALVRAQVESAEKPSRMTHGDFLSLVKKTNIASVDLEDMAEALVRCASSAPRANEVDRDVLKTEHAARWEEALFLAEQLADRLPVAKHRLLCALIKKMAHTERKTRRGSLYRSMMSSLGGHAHLVIPAVARYWRAPLSDTLHAEMARNRAEYVELQASLARIMRQTRTVMPDSLGELSGPWSVEELQEMEEEAQAHKDEVASDDEDIASILGDGGGGGSRSREAGGGRKTLDAAAIDVIARPSTPKAYIRPSPIPVGMFELYVFENPRELNLPPPRDIFGGDTPAGIGVAGMRDLPVWAGRDPDATRGMRAGDEYLWPEEKEEDEAVHGTEGSGDDWTQGAGTKELSTARQMEYQEVEDVILTGERKKRVPKVTIEDLTEDLKAQAIKTQLLRRGSLVAELHPDGVRREELLIEERAKRTIFMKDMPSRLDVKIITEAFARCGEIEHIVLKEPTFRQKKKTNARQRWERRYTARARSVFAYSTPHGLAVFRTAAGYEKATSNPFRIFGVMMDGQPVTTSPAVECRTVYVENVKMVTGVEIVDAINQVIQPYHKVMLKSHFLDDDIPQVVKLPLKNYVTAVKIEELLRAGGFNTAFHYNAPKAKRALGPPGKFLDDTNSTPPGSRPENGDPQITAKMIYDEIMDLKEKGHPSFVGKEFGDGDR